MLLGVVATIVFGVWGICLGMRKAKYPASISFIHEPVIGLFHDVTSKLPNLSITYKDSPVDSRVILVNGHIANDGAKDISPAMLEKQLVAVLPEEWRWLECKLLSKPKELNVTIQINSEVELGFDFGLFRKGESFSFQALISIDNAVDVKKNKSTIDKIDWRHRVANLGKIKAIILPHVKKRMINYVIPILGGVIYVAAGCMSMVNGPIERSSLNYMVPVDGNYITLPLVNSAVSLSKASLAL